MLFLYNCFGGSTIEWAKFNIGLDLRWAVAPSVHHVAPPRQGSKRDSPALVRLVRLDRCFVNLMWDDDLASSQTLASLLSSSSKGLFRRTKME